MYTWNLDFERKALPGVVTIFTMFHHFLNEKERVDLPESR